MKVFKVLLSFATVSLFALPSLAISREEAKEKFMVEDSYEAPPGKIFDEADYLNGTSNFKGYTNVIVINKKDQGPGAQTLRLYTNGELVLSTKASTGLENLEYVTPFKGFIRKFGRGSRASHWRHTTSGVYTVKRVEGPTYKSRESKFTMPYAMFFNDKRGLAVHAVPPDLSDGEASGERSLGQRASSGCVRVHKNVVQQIHQAVVSAGIGETPVLDTRTGDYVLESNGQKAYQNSYKTIVIVEEY